MVLLQIKERRSLRFQVRFAALFLGSLASVATAQAQQQPAFDGEFSVQRFNPAIGPRNFITTRGARVDGQMAWSAGFVANYGYRPLVVGFCTSADCAAGSSNRTEVPVVENLATADVMGSLTPIPRLQIGLRVPITWVKGLGLSEQGGSSVNGLQATGLGDIELEAKLRAYGEAKDPLVLGAALFATGPLGHATAKGNYIGDTAPSVGLRAILDFEQKGFSVGANLSGLYRGEGRLGTTHIGPEMRYNVAAGYRIWPVLRVIVDGFGSTRFTAQQSENPLEVNGAFQILPHNSGIAVLLGGGTGLMKAAGVPSARAFLGFTYTHEGSDADADGLDDAVDQCPTEAEDKDGYEDSDGCPDRDNDADGIEDSADKCPSKAEDQDSFEDGDGCPEADNDGDGVDDNHDQCPDKKETVNGFKDDDGCPDEPDADGDGVPDAKDKCPSAKEDTDGFQDTDGCPDPDNDGDGVLDDQDECGDEPETMNGFQDEDGCPDVAPGKKRQEPLVSPDEPAPAPAKKAPAKRKGKGKAR